MKKISDATIDRLKTISPASLVAHGIIKTAPDFRESKQQGYCCPLCGSGERNGTGAGTFDASNKFFCHACGNADVGRHKLSPIDLFAIAHGLKGENFGTIVREMCAEFRESLDEENFDVPRKRRTKTTPKTKAEPVNPAVLDIIRADLSVSDDALRQFVESCGGTWRGFDPDFLISHGVKFVEKWTSPKSRAAKQYSTPTPRILIPAGSDFYLARFVGNLDDYDEQAQKYIVEKANAGSPKLFLSTPNVLDSDAPIFAVEGAFDSLSVELAGYPAVALNGRGNGDLLVDALKRRQAEKMKLPLVIVLLDSDEAGREAAPTLYQSLINIGCPCCVRFLFDDVTKTDANDILVTDGVDNLRGRLESIVDSARAELDACLSELERRKQQRLDDETLNSLFQGKSSDLDFARRIETFRGSEIRWLTDDKSWLLYQRNEHGGLWRDGGEQNSCLLPFVREMSDIMTEYAEDENERELADKMKSTRKALSSITMLKGLDSILITADDLNREPFLLNCLNGVIDLQTGELIPAAPELLLTQQCNAAFDPNCDTSAIEDFFAQIMPEEMTRTGLQRWLGYCLTAETAAEKFAVWIGRTGANGKGTLSNTLLKLFGAYGAGLSPRALLKGNRGADADRATTSINALENARFAISEEMDMSGTLDASLVKNLTGGDGIDLRKNYGEFRKVISTAKINISGNFMPKIENVRDGGILRRLINFPFNVTFTKPDETLKRRLSLPENLSALLLLLVREAKAWYRRDDGGLIISKEMTQSRDELLSDSDFITDYLNEYYVFGEGLKIRAQELIDDLRRRRPADMRPYVKDKDLIRLVESVDGVTCEYDKHLKQRIFVGIDKLPPI